MRQFLIEKNDSGQRLDKFVSKSVRALPTSLMYKYIRTKRIKVNGKRAEQKQMLEIGDVVTMFIPDEFFEEGASENEFSRVKVKLDVIYEDENILLCDKPAGVLAHEGDGDEAGAKDIARRETLIFHILAYLFQKGEYDPAKEHSFAPALCNRIDRNTGGIVIAAKNAEALREMNELIREGNVRKTYLCAVHGTMPKKEDTLSAFLFKNTKTKTVTVTPHQTRGAKEIVTGYRVLSVNKEHDLSLLEVQLFTGRTHQIRAHMAYLGHPLLGEGKYGVNKSDRALGWQHQALYSCRVRFTVADGPLAYLNGREFAAKTGNIRFLSLFPQYRGK